MSPCETSTVDDAGYGSEHLCSIFMASMVTSSCPFGNRLA